MEPLDDRFNLDRLIHEPARLAILTVLTASSYADFKFLQSITGLSQGNLSSHIAHLEEAGLVVIERTYRRKRPYTIFRATPAGHDRYQAHWRQLDAVRNSPKDRRFVFPPRPATE